MRPTTNPTAFDAFANDYDATFTHSRLGQLLRPRVWAHLAAAFTAGQRIVELACGSGEDAIWLAQRGVQVTATDGSAEMIKMTGAKAKAAGVERLVEAHQVSLQAISEGHFDQSFDGAFANFGGLNTIGDWKPLARALATVVKPGGKAILVPMGPFCPWEIIWYLGHGKMKDAFRRFGGSAPAHIGEAVIPIWYPSARRLRFDFSPWFQQRRTESLALWLPPSYLDHLLDRWPRLIARLSRLEQASAHLTKGWGDHYISIFIRNTKDTKKTRRTRK